MAEPRKVPFVTISSFNTSPVVPTPQQESSKKRRREDEAAEVKPPGSKVPKGLAPPLDPSDPFADDDRERREVEAMAKKLENKYGGVPKKKKKDRMQDLIDIGFGYDDTDPFIDNSEAYDELVPASLTTKHGGFYINTGTLQFRAASDSEGENGGTEDNRFKKMKDGEERVIKKRRKKQDGGILEEKKPRKNKVPKAGVSLNAKVSGAADCNITDLTSDPAVMSLLGSTNNDILQDMMGDLDFEMLDSPQHSPLQGAENGAFGLKTAGGRGGQGVMAPPPLPSGLPAPLTKRIEDLRAASRLFDAEGRKKFFTLDMNNILLDIELQVQEQPAEVRSVVYCHLEAFVPCNKEALLKRLKKLSLNIQDDRLRTPLLKLKLAVCSVMPEQIARYNMDCIAKVAKQQSGEAEKNGSEDEDEEKPGKRVMGPRKKFVWDDKLRLLLCTLVRVKLGCYELEGKNSLSLEDYLKAFMETEVKPLWPKGWMQARMLFKESIMAHGHITGYTAKKKMVSTPKAKSKEAVWMQRSTPLVQSPANQVAKRPPLSPSETICLDSSDDQLTVPSLDSISQALAILGNAAKGLLQLHASPILLQQHKKNSLSPALYISTSSSPSTPLSRPPISSPSTPLTRPLSVTSTPLTRPLSVTSAPLPSVRVDGMGVTHRLSVLNTSRTLPLPVGVSKANMSNFITPMHATLTKSTHSSIVKLTARPTLVTTTTASPVISQALPQRSQAAPPLHQYSAKTPFRPPQFSGVQVVKPGSYTPPGGQKTPNNSSSTTNISLINASSISKHSGSNASPIIVSANQGQRQRLGGGTSQGAKQVMSVTSSSVSSQLPQVSTAGGGLLGSGSPLGLGFGMLGGLVPVSLPFHNAANSAAFSTLTQNLYKSLQSGSQVALPPHLQLAFSDVTQSQGGDAKRKTL
ncbi:Ubinuclein-2 [Dissostichus eleginoides]|uniref:Ubinuclein-2 n=1 Tax=Dissostichus eleginoides TaxID=100907 RepID=A0AAD9ET57_DISEL|nr:Ubinuclein-2 [Dissostichus eleginoides]